MKRIFLSIITVIFFVTVIAQVDRTKAPEGGSIPEIKFNKVETFKLKNGLTVIVEEYNKFPSISMYLQFDYEPPTFGDKAGLNDIFGPMMLAGTKNFTKEELDEELDFLGTNLGVSSNSIGFSSLKRNFNKSLNLLREILFHPTFDNTKELNKLKKQLITSIDALEKDVDKINGRVSNAVLYGKNHPFGEFKTKKTITNLKLDDFKKYYTSYFKPNSAYLSFVGDITLEEAKEISEKYFSSWQSSGTVPKNPEVYKKPAQKPTEIVLIDLPEATQANIYIAELIDLEMSDKDYHATILGNQILGGQGSRLFKNIREDKGYTYGAYSSVSVGKYQSDFSASAKVRNAVVDSAIVEFLKEIKTLTNELPTEEEIQSFKKVYTSSFLFSLEGGGISASYTINELINNLKKDYYKDFLKTLNAQTKKDVLDAFKSNIDPKTLKIFVVGRAEELLPKLKRLNMPIKFYDKWANPIADPTQKKLADLSALEVVNQYLKAIGGKELLLSKKTMTKKFDIQIKDMPFILKAVEIKTSNNKKSLKIAMVQDPSQTITQGKLAMHEVFDGEKGFVNNGQFTAPMEQAKVDEFKLYDKGLFPQLYYHEFKDKFKMEGIVKYEDHEVYKFKYSVNNEDHFEYYDTKTFLLEKKESWITVDGQQYSTVIKYADYKEVDGIKQPFTITVSSGQTQNVKLKSVSYDDKIDDSEFDVPVNL